MRVYVCGKELHVSFSRSLRQKILLQQVWYDDDDEHEIRITFFFLFLHVLVAKGELRDVALNVLFLSVSL